MKKRRKSGRVTLSDVAREAGVSPITVSRALRSPGMVSKEVVKRIEQVVGDLGYVPDPAARALASQRTDVIGVIIPSVTNNVFSDVMRGIYARVEETNYRIQLGNSRYSQKEEEKLLQTFVSQRPAGLMVSGIDQSDEARQILEDVACPVVQIMETGPDPVDMMVGFSHRDAARAAAEHLIAKGYERIGFIGARMDPRTARRLEGYREALRAAGRYDEGLERTTAQRSTVTLGSGMLLELKAGRPDLDAVLCNNDDLALGALFACQRQGISVPDEFGICGFNDLEMMAASCPSITSVRTYREEMGVRGTDMLIQAIEGGRSAEANVDLGFDVIARESTARREQGGEKG
ncbi:LacI family DNA-binding transcriptional regulator [Rhizobiales bacterium]|uniref:LacI family DNA-binding transcriptional regulator n=1 Tax=Hongsoonwoonella zoysiae TaxID=2821844 RepID=UPI0015604826|nr:LacI family DNA-binding transcriptional regulator [Hongsoonwoonella zoysiae]NRG16924.1 LacI family DNA-binding transcriptional regulator [Hongsoonwoonella zoysiae]